MTIVAAPIPMSAVTRVERGSSLRPSRRGPFLWCWIAIGFVLAGALNGGAPAAERSDSQPSQKPILRIDPGVHSAIITSMVMDKACTRLVTGSLDKTVRIWGLPPDLNGNKGRLDQQANGTLTLIRTLRPPISLGGSGRVYAVALSPDSRLVAVGGWLSSLQNWIYVFDAMTGQVARVLGPVSHRASGLAFSPKGDLLAAILRDGGGLRVWETSRWQLVSADSRYTEFASAAFDKRGNVFTTSRDGYIRLYAAGAVATAGNSLRPKVEAKSRLGFTPGDFSLHSASNRLAVGYANSNVVDVFDASTLRRLYAIGEASTTSHGFSVVAWSEDGRRLYVAGKHQVDGKTIVRIWEDGGKGQNRDVAAGPDNAIVLLAPCGPGFGFVSLDPAFGTIDSEGKQTAWQTSVIRDRRAMLFDNLIVSDDGMRLRFRLKERGNAPVLFDLQAERLADATDPPSDLYDPDTKTLSVSDWIDSVSPKLDGKPITLDKYERVYALAIAPGKTRFVLGTSSRLRAYSLTGKLDWENRQEAGSAYGVNIPRNGKLLIAAYGDGTIRWHRLDNGQELLALFVHKDDRRWVAWTPKGYYVASPGAESLIGWHVNRGWNEAAQFFSVDRFRDQFNRPDIVKLVLETLDEERAVDEANERSGLKRAPETIRATLPPVVEIMRPANDATFHQREVTLEYMARSPTGQPITDIDVRINGSTLGARAALPVSPGGGEVNRLTLPLPPHDVTITLVAREGDRPSQPASIRLRWDGVKPGEIVLPRLRGLFVGVSDYKLPELRLALAAKDATDLEAYFRTQEGKAYRKVETRVLANADRADVLAGLDWLEKDSEEGDVNILFLAGHGVTDDKGYFYYLAADALPSNLRATAVGRDEVLRTIRNRKGAMVVMLDTCQSGASVDASVPTSSPVDMNRLVNELGDKTLGVFLYASALGRQFSYENPAWGNGAFTKAMIEGLSGKADRENTGFVDTDELALYVRRRVLEMTTHMQEPVRIKPDAAPEMRIARLKP
jgi:WD40 repeat protein